MPVNYITIVAPTYEDAVRSAREQYGDRIRIHSRKDVVEKGFLGLGRKRHCELTCFLSDTAAPAAKQSAAVAAALFGMWGYAILMGGLYFLVGYRIGLTLYLTAITLLTLTSAGLLYYWICRKGTKIFAAL